MPNTQGRLLPKGMSFSTTAPYDFGKTSYLNKRYGDLSNPETIGDISPELKKRLLASNVNLDYNTNIGKDRFNLSTQVSPFGSKQGRFGPVNVEYQKNLGNLGQLDYTGSFDKNTNLKKAFNPENFIYSNRFNNQGISGSIDVAPKRSLSGKLDVGQDLALKYNRGKDDQGRLTSVGGTFNPAGKFSMDYTQDFRPGKVINQRLSGNYNTDNFSASGYRNVGAEEGKTFGGKFSKNTGDITYGGGVDYGPQGLQNLQGNLTASDLFNLSYSRNREGDGFTKTIGGELMPGQPFSANYNRTFNKQGMDETTIGGNLNLKNLQASLSKTYSGEGNTMQGNIDANLGKRVTLGATGDFTNNRLNKLGVRTGVNIIPGFDIKAGVEKEIGTGKPKFTFEPTINKSIVPTSKKRKPFTSIKNELQQNEPQQNEAAGEDVEVYKKGGKVKNDRAMVSGVSSILRKIKDKKNRKEVAGDMVNQFNREGVNYNKEKFLKNSRSLKVGGITTKEQKLSQLYKAFKLKK